MTNAVFSQWRKNSTFFQPTPQKGAQTVKRERDDTTLDKIWGLKPVHTGIVIRRPRQES